MQILKQADVVMLNYLLPDKFDRKQCAANLAFYEPRTIHDSSLSQSIHGIVAARCGDTPRAYAFWRAGAAIDLGDDPHSCDDGIHAAATGAIWSGVVQGFAGMQIIDGELHLTPQLPAHWQRLQFSLQWHAARLDILVEGASVTLRSSAPIAVKLWGETRHLIAHETRTVDLPEFGTATTEGDNNV
jgi:hypothetical glycosyl hydrolase